MKELAVRVAVAVVGIPLLIFVLLKGGLVFYLFSVIVTILAQTEIYQLFAQKEAKPQVVVGLFSGQIVLALLYTGYKPLLVLCLLIFMVILFASEMFRNKGSALLNTGATITGMVYPTLFWGSLLFLRQHLAEAFAQPYAFGGKFILTMFVAIWICDTLAYFYGKRFGKHRLFERVSPKKSWEGAIAGLIGAVLVYLVVYFQKILPITLNVAVVSALIVGVGGQFGDLVESWFKRDAGVKDSSHLLPGHGGILDRFDSVMFSSVLFLIFYFFYTM